MAASFLSIVVSAAVVVLCYRQAMFFAGSLCDALHYVWEKISWQYALPLPFSASDFERVDERSNLATR